jgi:ribosomal protein L37AE/L43A
MGKFMMLIWECNKCGKVIEMPANYSGSGECSCGGYFLYKGFRR